MTPTNTRGALLALGLLLTSESATGQVTSFDTILSTTCDGRIRLFPDNELLNVNVDAPFIPRVFGKVVDGVRTYVKTKCGNLYSEDVFNSRFDGGRFWLTGNKWFKELDSRSDACLDDPTTFTRDGPKMYEALFSDQMEYDMPSTCNWNTWDESGSCAFEYAVRGLQDTTAQVRIERCSRLGGGFPRVFVGCRGRGCSAFTPCTSSSSCGANQKCTDIVDFIGTDNLRRILEGIGYYKDSSIPGDPRQLVENVIAAFGGLFPGGVRVGASVCLPEALGNFNTNGWNWYGYSRNWIERAVNSLSGGWEKGLLMNYPSRSDCNTATQYTYRWPQPPQYIKYTTRNLLSYGIVTPWNGLVGGTNPLVPKAYWVSIPNVEFPNGESHIASVQCDGVIHVFAGTAFAVRIYHPQMNNLLEFWAAQNMAAYPLGLSDYLNNMAIWRVEPYLYTMQMNSAPFGNIMNIWDNDFFFDVTKPGMSVLDMANWEANKQMSVSIGLPPQDSHVLGSDFRANIRAGQCPGTTTGLTSVHVTCVGAACQELLLKRTCAANAECAVGSCNTLNGYYDNDYLAQVLWGVDDSSLPTPWPSHVACPARQPPGDNYGKLTTSLPMRGMLNGVWNGMQYADCEGRVAEKCVSECTMTGATCVPVNGVPPTWPTNFGFCYPELGNLALPYTVEFDGGITFDVISPPFGVQYDTMEVVTDPFPEPTHPVPEPEVAFAGVETLATGNCEGQFRFFPENELLAFSIDAQIVPRLFGEAMKAVHKYVSGRCQEKGKTPPNLDDIRFTKRFHPLSYLVFSGNVDEYDSCLDDSDTFVRDFLKLWKEREMNMVNLYLPETCNNATWFEKGSCTMKIPIRVVPDAAVTINIERCDSNYGYVRFAVGCEGGGCNSMGNPCNVDDDCGGNSRCVDPIEELGAGKVFDFFRDVLHYLGPQATQSDAVRVLFNDFVTQFGPYFKGSATPGLGNKKVCFAKEYAFPGDNPYSYPYYNHDGVEIVTNSKRKGQDNVMCGVQGSEYDIGSYNSKFSSTMLQTRRSITPGLLPAGDGSANTTYYSMYPFYFSRGHKLTDTFGRPVVSGGGACTTHQDCSTDSVKSLCLTSYDLCTLADDPYYPYNDTDCDSYSTTDFKCSCSMGSPLAPNTNRWPYVFEGFASIGEMCQTPKYKDFFDIGKTYGFDAPDAPTFKPWDGLLRDGKSQFERGDQWPKFPEVQIPSGETHVMSVQCDGLVTFFEGTPFAIRVYLPKKQELLQFIADKYIASMSTWIPSGLDPSIAFNVDQAPWRPEMYLARFLSKTGLQPAFSSVASEFGFGSSVLGMGDFTYEKFLEGKESGVGFSYSGMRYVMGDDFKANVRFQQCSAYPNGLVGMDVTCVGKICSTLQLKKPCAVGSRCAIGSCVSTHFYDQDFLANLLWGTGDDELRSFGHDWVYGTTCPASTKVGTQGVRQTDNSLLFQNAASVYSLLISDDCAGRPECTCQSGCVWDGSSCSATASVDPRWEEQEINVCLPKLIPFPDAFIKDLGYKTGEIGKQDSANIYSVSVGTSMDRPVTIYGIDDDVEVIGAALKTNITIPDYSCDSSGSGGSSNSGGGSNGGNGSSSNSGSGSDSGNGTTSDSTDSASNGGNNAADESDSMETGTVILIAGGAVVGALLVGGFAMYVTKAGPFKPRTATFDPEIATNVFENQGVQGYEPKELPPLD